MHTSVFLENSSRKLFSSMCYMVPSGLGEKVTRLGHFFPLPLEQFYFQNVKYWDFLFFGIPLYSTITSGSRLQS